MIQDEIIEMARESGLETQDGFSESVFYFAKLVALRYEKKIADLENIICQRYWNVLQEREACAKICDDWESDEAFVANIADAIRTRGQA